MTTKKQIFIIVLLLGVLGTCAYYFTNNNTESPPIANLTIPPFHESEKMSLAEKQLNRLEFKGLHLSRLTSPDQETNYLEFTQTLMNQIRFSSDPEARRLATVVLKLSGNYIGMRLFAPKNLSAFLSPLAAHLNVDLNLVRPRNHEKIPKDQAEYWINAHHSLASNEDLPLLSHNTQANQESKNAAIRYMYGKKLNRSSQLLLDETFKVFGKEKAAGNIVTMMTTLQIARLDSKLTPTDQLFFTLLGTGLKDWVKDPTNPALASFCFENKEGMKVAEFVDIKKGKKQAEPESIDFNIHPGKSLFSKMNPFKSHKYSPTQSAKTNEYTEKHFGCSNYLCEKEWKNLANQVWITKNKEINFLANDDNKDKTHMQYKNIAQLRAERAAFFALLKEQQAQDEKEKKESKKAVESVLLIISGDVYEVGVDDEKEAVLDPEDQKLSTKDFDIIEDDSDIDDKEGKAFQETYLTVFLKDDQKKKRDKNCDKLTYDACHKNFYKRNQRCKKVSRFFRRREKCKIRAFVRFRKCVRINYENCLNKKPIDEKAGFVVLVLDAEGNLQEPDADDEPEEEKKWR